MQAGRMVWASIALALLLLIVPAAGFVAAGTMNWPMAWVYAALLWSSTLASRMAVLLRDPEALYERAMFTSSAGTQLWDRSLVVVVGFLGPVATMVVAGLDRRWGWSDVVPGFVQVLAALLVAGGYGFGVWAMLENRYFSSVARIQVDRGQQLVTTGPYRIVRHPGYAGMVLVSLALPAMLNALWALIPALALVAAFVLRTALEDRMLREELQGYPQYAETTLYRLLPGVW